MRLLFFITILSIGLYSCDSSNQSKTNNINGTWQLFYGSIKEGDSLKIKDVSQSNFIKIINDTHFAFFNQENESSKSFYGGAGTYTLSGDTYIESLDYIENENIRGHKFPFTLEIKGDTLIQYGHEKVESANIDRYIVEKYLRVK